MSQRRTLERADLSDSLFIESVLMPSTLRTIRTLSPEKSRPRYPTAALLKVPVSPYRGRKRATLFALTVYLYERRTKQTVHPSSAYPEPDHVRTHMPVHMHTYTHRYTHNDLVLLPLQGLVAIMHYPGPNLNYHN